MEVFFLCSRQVNQSPHPRALQANTKRPYTLFSARLNDTPQTFQAKALKNIFQRLTFMRVNLWFLYVTSINFLPNTLA